MSLILSIGHHNKYKLNSIEDAQKLIEILDRSVPVTEIDWKYLECFQEKFGKTIAFDNNSTNEIEITMCNGEPIEADVYSEALKQFEKEFPKKNGE